MAKGNAAKQHAQGHKNPRDETEQFDRFEQLTRRLLAVPKQEPDKEREKKSGKKKH